MDQFTILIVEVPNESIQVSQLSYRYANRTEEAIRDIKLRFEGGQVILIAGESGSGKTTLFRCINGLIPHSYRNGTLTGEVLVLGQPAAKTRLAQLARHIGTVLQDPEKQLVSAQVRGDIAFGLENLGLPREDIAVRVEGTARRLNIEHLLDRPTHSLSGGERQKVAIAGVLAMHPQILLFDEPLASLDPRSAREALGLFRSVADDGVTVIMIEHRVKAALHANPDQCIEIARGQVRFQGDASEFQQWRGHAANGQLPIDEVKSIAPPRTPSTSTPQTGPLLVMREVQFAYADKAPTLHNVSLAIQPGDVIALMGPNGAGKSTLSKLAIGLLRPQRGEVRIGQRDSADLSVAEIARNVGYVFQHPSAMLFADNLREELSFGPRNIGRNASEIEPAIARAMQQVNLDEISLERSPFSLSYGQQKRVAIASVLAMQSPLLFLDEPTAGLDDVTAHQLMQSLLDEHATQQRLQAIVFITHDLSLAQRYANRMLVLAQGEIVADDAPDKVLRDQPLLERYHLL